MNKGKGPQLNDLLRLDGLEKPADDVRAFWPEKKDDLMRRSMSEVADEIEDSEDVGLGELIDMVAATRENVEGMMVNYLGDEMTWKEYAEIENVDENTEDCRDILKNDRSFKWAGLSYLPVAVAERLASLIFGDVHFAILKKLNVPMARALAKKHGGLTFRVVEYLSPEVAAEFGKHSGILSFEALEEMSVEVARAIAPHQGHFYLPVMKTMSPEVAAELAKCPSHFSFASMEEMDVEVAKALSVHQGGFSFAGMKKLDAAVAAELAKTSGAMHFWEIKKIDVETAQALGKFSDYLGFEALEEMDEDVAKGLASGPKQMLHLKSLKEFRLGVTAALGQLEGGMVFEKITKMTDEDARGFANFKGSMRMSGLTDLSEEAAKILGEANFEMTRVPKVAKDKIDKYRPKKNE